MAKKKLPLGFQSWIEFHDYLKREKPDLFRFKTIRFMAYQPLGNVREEYSISIACIERQCWKEIEALRLDTNDMYRVFQVLLQSTVDVQNKEKIIRFLKKIRKD